MTQFIDTTSYLHVVAAAIMRASDGALLLARRPEHLHQGGLWEFPGGKVEAAESTEQALVRELEEELGITARRFRPLIRVAHCYPDRNVLLDVWQVEAFDGSPHGREGQATAWVVPSQLGELQFPAANAPIVTACRLPERLLITPDPGAEVRWSGFLQRLAQVVASGVGLVQLRAKSLSVAQMRRLAREATAIVHAGGAQLMLNTEAPIEGIEVDGLHLSSTGLQRWRERPVGADRWLSCACHSVAELAMAQQLGCDFVLASPVKATASHPQATPLGWSGFEQITQLARIPVYALGGVGSEDLATVWRHGGQGIAAIRSLWGTVD